MATKVNNKITQSIMPTLKIVSFIIVLILLFLSINTLRQDEFFPIRSVKVFGISHVDHQEIQDKVAPFVSHGFFAVDIESIKDSILQIPWVSEVMVRRIWPDRVIVTVNEKNPVALWNDSGLLSSAGEVFNPATQTYPANLPHFLGPLGEQILMTNYYEKINNILNPLRSKIIRLELSPALVWTITLDNGIKLNIEHKEILTRLDQFVKVYPKIVGDRVSNVDYIDLRYPNGMAVRWKSAT